MDLVERTLMVVALESELNLGNSLNGPEPQFPQLPNEGAGCRWLGCGEH